MTSGSDRTAPSIVPSLALKKKYAQPFHFGNSADSQICVYARMVARSGKMIHYLMFMVNESTGKVAAHFECVNALVDLQARKTTPYPAEILTRIDAMLAEQSRLAWAPPTSSTMQV